MSTARKLIRSSLWRNMELAVLLAVTFLMTPFIVHSLGNRMYGVWTLIGTFIGYYGLLDFGLSSAASRYISQSLGRGDLEDMNHVANTAFSLFSLVGLAALLLTLLAVAVCPAFIHDPEEVALFRKIILLLGVATAVGFPVRVFGGVLNSYLRYDYLSGISIARTLLSNAAIYYYLSRGGGVMAVTVISFIFSLLQNAGTYAASKAQCPHVRIAGFRYDRAKVRAMFNYSWKTFVCQVGDLLRFRIDSLMIAGFLEVSLVTPYTVGVRLVDGFSQLVGSSIGTMMPVFSQYEGRGDYDAIRNALLKVTTLSTLLCAFVGFSIIFYAKAFIFRWMGPGFDRSYYITVILCIASIIALPQSPGIQLLYGISKHNYYAVLNTCEAVLNVILSYVFLRYYGMYGVALGTMVEMLLFKLFIQPIYICRSIQLPVRVYLFDTILGTLLKSAVALGVYFYLIKDMVTPSYGRLCACVVAQALLFIPAAYFFILSQAERQFIRIKFNFT